MNGATRQKVNLHLHTVVMGLECGYHYCANCGGVNISDGSCNERGCEGQRHVMLVGTPMPDYCSDDSPRRLLDEVVAKVAEDIGTLAFGEALNADRPKMTVGELKKTPVEWHFYISLSSVLRMTPEQTSLAICRATGYEQSGGE